MCKKYRDDQGNVYRVDLSVKTGRFMVLRVNSGGHPKKSPLFPDSYPSSKRAQAALDLKAAEKGWMGV